ncbi:MAG TPA: FG-GAP repeat protein, partial [Xanthomonadales bacterium]|nr:FG-GAP repeat protein [Xanthomonadales bacterium]
TLFVYECAVGSCDSGTELPAASNTSMGLGVSVSLVGDELLSGASYAAVFSHGGQGKVFSFRWSGSHWLEAPALDTGIGYQAGAFGLAVASEGRTMIACARDTPAQAGTCYVYERVASGWSLRQQMAPLDPRYFAYFGSSVALSGDVAVVGAPGRGSAYVFQRSASGFWAQRARFDGAASANFGQVVAVRGDTVAVGAPITAFPPGLGAVHVFERAGESWAEREMFLGSDVERLGSSIAIGDNLILAGAPGGEGPGAALVFARNAGTWSLQQVLAPTDQQARMEFGAAVALDGDRALVGAPRASAGPEGATGVVYELARVAGSWTQPGFITASDRGVGDEFGSGIVLEDGRALIASRYHRWGVEGYIRGAVYVHDLTDAGTWNETAQLRLPESGTSPAIAIAGECLLVGAFAATTESGPFANPQSGGVYSFGCNLFGDGFE